MQKESRGTSEVSRLPLSTEQDLETMAVALLRDSTDQPDGGLCWNASLVLANYLTTTQPGLVGSTVRQGTEGSIPHHAPPCPTPCSTAQCPLQ
jgi:hypothetical protein